MKSKPVLISNAKHDLQSRLVHSLILEIERNNIYRNCLACLNFREKEEICILAKARPPARVIVEGCKMFEDKDEIPF